MSEVLVRVDERTIRENLGTDILKKEDNAIEVRRKLSEVLLVGEFSTTVMPEMYFENQEELREMAESNSKFNPRAPFENIEDMLGDEKEKQVSSGFCLYNLAQNSFGEYNYYRLGSFIYKVILRGEVDPPSLSEGQMLTEVQLNQNQISQRRAKTYKKAAELVEENNNLILESLKNSETNLDSTAIEFGIPTIAEMAVLEVKRPELFLAFDYYWTSTERTNKFGEKSNLVVPGQRYQSEITGPISLRQGETHPNIGFLVIGRKKVS